MCSPLFFQEKLSSAQVGGPSPDALRALIHEEIQAICSGSAEDKATLSQKIEKLHFMMENLQLLRVFVQGALAQFFSTSSSTNLNLHSIPANLSSSNLMQTGATGLESNWSSATEGVVGNISRHPSFLQGPSSSKVMTSAAGKEFESCVEFNGRAVSSSNAEQSLQKQQHNQLLFQQVLAEPRYETTPIKSSLCSAPGGYGVTTSLDSFKSSHNNGLMVERLPEVKTKFWSEKKTIQINT